MVDNSQKPKEHDVVLGSHSKTPADGVVLGGLERIKQLVAHGKVEQKIDALLDAFEYGQAGVEIIIHSLHDSSREVREAAYFLLQESTELSAKKVLIEYIPYDFFKCLHTWNEDTEIPLCFSISSDGKIIVSANNEKCQVLNLKTGQLIKTLDFHFPVNPDFPNRSYITAVNPDLQNLVIEYEGIISVLDIQTENIIRTLTGHYVSYLAANLNEKTADCAIIYYDSDEHSDPEHPVKVWNLQTGQLVSTIYGHTGKAHDLIINPREQFLIIIYFHFSDARGWYDIVIKKWDLQTGEQIDTFKMPLSQSERFFCPTLSQDGKTLVSCSVDGCIKVWNLQTKKIIHILQGYPPFYLSLKANILVSNVSRADNTIILWDLLKGEKICTLQGSTPVSFSTDTKVLVSGGADNTIIVWDLQTGEKLCTLKGHSSQIADIAISPDGKTIVSSSVNSSYYANDATIKVWGV